jgi:hypothetical protein
LAPALSFQHSLDGVTASLLLSQNRWP